ncbi:long-chain fatty acid--CoA ligase [Ammoniphilus oxalaticus]|uniref:Long-chain fatty acid--CoA ligase n=1 Tax=Ammoniphilus oxalaticus TaxID=66863 RepID=A0A419SIG5_9BACL|nr:long-chain fatty acid--CoA ligase [Ammoniphilus oxalaticus]RKD23834.1 long-chain fatty acid--CoA ligase [Ammoniphilus oxalaticus]
MNSQPWLTNYPPMIPAQLDYPKIALTEFLTQAAKQYPDHRAIQFLGKIITYRELLSDAQHFAGALQQKGIQKGDRVAIMLPNCPQAVISYYGILMLGAVVVQVNPLYKERELAHQLGDSGAKFIVCLDLLYPIVKKTQVQTSLQHVIVTGIQDYLPFPKSWVFPVIQRLKGKIKKIEPDDFSFKNLLVSASPCVSPASIDPSEDLALLQYTGGTTGVAKGVMLTHRNLVANVIQCRAWFYKAEQGKENFLAVIPFFHVYGMTVAMNLSICFAGCLITLPRFEIPSILKTIQKQKPTVFPGAPTMYIALLQHPELSNYDISSIEACLSGSAALPLEIQEKFEQVTGGRLVEGYGLTECSPVTHANPLWDQRKNGSIGLPWPDTDAKVVDLESGEALPPGGVGELIVKGPQVMKGYWNEPDETEAVLRDGWLYTGDLAYMDEDGFFFIVDRKKDLIIASGFNIYPREVEEVLFEHPAIAEAAVVGVADDYRGETVKAFLVLKEGETVSEEQLDQFCRKRLAAFKVPKQYEFRAELPKSSIGKVLKKLLIEG